MASTILATTISQLHQQNLNVKNTTSSVVIGAGMHNTNMNITLRRFINSSIDIKSPIFSIYYQLL